MDSLRKVMHFLNIRPFQIMTQIKIMNLDMSIICTSFNFLVFFQSGGEVSQSLCVACWTFMELLKFYCTTTGAILAFSIAIAYSFYSIYNFLNSLHPNKYFTDVYVWLSSYCCNVANFPTVEQIKDYLILFIDNWLISLTSVQPDMCREIWNKWNKADSRLFGGWWSWICSCPTTFLCWLWCRVGFYINRYNAQGLPHWKVVWFQ